ncbi:hypothetical protein ACKQTC_07260 [Peptococcus simiae]|uniref:Uncharacterized protein n=1 Tax=Peptococcus simiae TaxID=1643805 RepID=A0ABW9H023_9FIRM
MEEYTKLTSRRIIDWNKETRMLTEAVAWFFEGNRARIQYNLYRLEHYSPDSCIDDIMDAHFKEEVHGPIKDFYFPSYYPCMVASTTYIDPANYFGHLRTEWEIIIALFDRYHHRALSDQLMTILMDWFLSAKEIEPEDVFKDL